MKQVYQRDIYESINEFRMEYSSEYNENGENSRGMDFIYKNQEYRLCREYDDVFYLYKRSSTNINDMDVIGVCNSIEELLKSKYIDNITFETIIMNENDTIIYGKD